MVGRLTMLLAVIVLGTLTYMSKDLVASLAVFSWGFTAYMAIRIVYVAVNMVPQPVKYRTLRLYVPPRVSQHSLPQILQDQKQDNGSVMGLVNSIVTKIGTGADPMSVNQYFAAQITMLRRLTHEKYSTVSTEINVLGFEGIIGTLIGMIAFLAQGAILFKFGGDAKDSTALVDALLGNLKQIDLVTVSTAFLTSIIGWGAKAWIGLWVDQRKGIEQESITLIEGWFLNEVLSHLTAEEQEIPEFPVPDYEKLDRMTDALTAFTAVVKQIVKNQELEFDVELVKGGYRLSRRTAGKL